MAVGSNTLNNMSVKAQTGPNEGMLMPKLQFRFRLNFINFGSAASATSLTKQVIDCSRPNVSFAEIPIQVYNSTIKLAGKHTWTDMTCNVRDDATGAVSTLVGQQLQKQLDFFEMASAAAGQDYKFTTVLDILDGGNGMQEPNVLEQWEILGCYLKTANYNTLNYGTSEAVTIALTIAFDNAIQATNGVAGPVGQAGGSQIRRVQLTGGLAAATGGGSGGGDAGGG
jgi:hypothetical protein